MKFDNKQQKNIVSLISAEQEPIFSNWRDYKWQLKHSIKDIETFEKLTDIKLSKKEKSGLRRTIDKFPLSITPYYLSLIDKDDYINDPVFKQSFPDSRELILEKYDMSDPLHEDKDSPVVGITHRYPDRVLFIVSNTCSMYCRHCTRKRKVGDSDYIPSKKEIMKGINYIKNTPVVRDVLLSGGDPFMLSDSYLDWILTELQKIPHIEVIRIGTRMPAVLPYRITDDLVEMLKKHHPLWINTHFNHPREITGSAKESLRKLADAGIPLGNQSVLLAGVNDCPRIIKKLSQDLVQSRVRPYYLYQCDLTEGLSHFRTPVGKGIEIIENLIGHTSGFAIPTYIIDTPGGAGKIPVMPNYIISWSTNKIVLRNYEGVISTYKEPDSYKPVFCDRNCADCKLTLKLDAAKEVNATGIGKLLSNFDKTITLTPKHTGRAKRRNKNQKNISDKLSLLNLNNIKSVLIVGSWAKEQITIENIKSDKRIKVFSYLDTKNQGILSLVDGYKIGSLYKIEDIVKYAKTVKADLVIITTAFPLSFGIVDVLEAEKIPVFGPNSIAAKLESDKEFARKLMRKYRIDALPEFNVFSETKPAIQYAKDLQWNVAVKPISLTEGLGVKVSGDQLRNKKEVIDYITNILNDNSKVLIEEKLEGEEFTLQCLVNGTCIIPTPAVQDFKKKLPGDKGLNTASMGSYSDIGRILPFMKEKDYDSGIDIIRKTVKAFQAETGQICRGFLYGQFMITEKGIKLIEYNFRPGDPEWMNTLIILKDNVLDIIKDLLRGKERKLRLENKASVCKYIVPNNYPEKLNEVLDIAFIESDIKKEDVNIYYSCGVNDNGKLNTGSERGIALIGKADTVSEANKKVEKAVSLINGNFHYRFDIGTEEMIKSKIAFRESRR